jgi:hypothetical protein
VHQRPIRLGDLKVQIKRIKQIMATPSGATAVNAVIDHYKRLANHLATELQEIAANPRTRPIKWEQETRKIIVQTAHNKDVEDTVLQLLAMGFAWIEDFDGYFASDDGFRFEVVNVFLKGSSAWQRRTLSRDGKPTAFRSRINRKTREYLAAVLIDHVVKHGVALADNLKRKAEAEDREKAKLSTLMAEAVN